MDHQLQTVQVYNQYVKAYVDKFMNFDLYNDTFDDFLSMTPWGGNVLELGCGPGNVIKYFSSQRADLAITGVDLAPEMLKEAQKLNPEVSFQLLDIRNAGQITEKYEAIVGAFCLPYLNYEDLDPFFANLNYLTLEDGLIYLSCMEGAVKQSGFEKTSFTGDSELYIYYHQRENLEQKLKTHGFEIEKFYTKDYPEADGSVTIDLIYIARKITEIRG